MAPAADDGAADWLAAVHAAKDIFNVWLPPVLGLVADTTRSVRTLAYITPLRKANAGIDRSADCCTALLVSASALSRWHARSRDSYWEYSVCSGCHAPMWLRRCPPGQSSKELRGLSAYEGPRKHACCTCHASHGGGGVRAGWGGAALGGATQHRMNHLVLCSTGSASPEGGSAEDDERRTLTAPRCDEA